MKKFLLVMMFVLLAGKVFADDLFVTVLCNPPKEMIGFGLGGYDVKHNIGLFFDLKSTVHPRDSEMQYDNIDQNMAENIFRDTLLKIQEDILTVDLGLLNRINTSDYIYYGLGITTFAEHRKYIDNYGILGQGGQYWITGKQNSELNILAGFIFSIGKNMIFQIGLETRPTSFIFGLGGRFDI